LNGNVPAGGWLIQELCAQSEQPKTGTINPDKVATTTNKGTDKMNEGL
jgi:hypothetical protein